MTARDHLLGVVLTWWDEHGPDDDLGGVLTCFDNAGALISTEKYTWSQGRWAWLCAELAVEADAGRLPLDADVWRERCRRTAEFLVRHACLPDGRTAFRTTREGVVIPDDQRQVATSVFADLFVALGLAGAVRVVPDAPASWLATAEAILLRAERDVAARTARTEPYPVPAGFRDLAGPMNLLHTASELCRAGAGAAAGNVRDRARATLLTGDEAFLRASWWWEFQPAPGASIETLLARHRTPGHLLELLWMLIWADGIAGVESDLAQYEHLATKALTLAWDSECGGLLRYVDRDGGKPRGSVGPERGPYEELVAGTWDTKLWWVHADTMVATRLLSRLTGSEEMREWDSRVKTYTMATFPDPAGNEWLQIRRRTGEPLDSVVALPVKDPFHIIRALLLITRIEAGLSLEGTEP